MNKHRSRFNLLLGTLVIPLLSLAMLWPVSAATTVGGPAAPPSTGATDSSLASAVAAHPGVRMPYPGELTPMSAHAVNPKWGAPQPPNPNNPNPMGPLQPVQAPPVPLAHPTGKEVPLIPAPPLPASAVSPATAPMVGGGSADFMWKTNQGVSGPPSQSFYDPSVGHWTDLHSPHGGATLQAPAVLSYRGQFQVVVLGGDHQLYQAFYNPPPDNRWYGFYAISVPSPYSTGFTSAPAIASYNGDFHIFARGNDFIWHAWYCWSCGQWYGWVDQSAANSRSAPTATSYYVAGSYNQLAVYYVNENGTNADLMEVYYDTGGWHGPVTFAYGPWYSAPATTQYFNQLQTWDVGYTGSAYLLYQYYFVPGTGWRGPVLPLADPVGSAPAIAPYTTGGSQPQFQVFYVSGATAGTWATHQYFYNPPPDNRYYGPLNWGNLSSAPSITQFQSQFQVWWRDP